ncbi:acyltransferase [bacterium]|nr:acyltransferase [bacterium]
MTDNRFDVEDLRLGRDIALGQRLEAGAIGGPAKRMVLGDNVTIGDDVRILAPEVEIGDFVTLTHHVTIYGYDKVVIGANSWIAQNVILNCTAPLSIGRGAIISAYANLWTHFSGGDTVEGCRFDSKQAATLGEDVWIGVMASIAPVEIGDKALVLAGSVVTKNIAANRVYGGNPAMDLTAKLGAPYVAVSADEKYRRMCELLSDFAGAMKGMKAASGGDAAASGDSVRGGNTTASGSGKAAGGPDAGSFTLAGITIARADVDPGDPAIAGTSVFDVRDRSYSKLRTREELAFMRFLLPKVKFYPRGS